MRGRKNNSALDKEEAKPKQDEIYSGHGSYEIDPQRQGDNTDTQYYREDSSWFFLNETA
ncbi:hypothetical protein GEI7407_3062 [Geitlerinema sp. PCC 7407]|nr:hypothetical protein GEI7407_3062 [Geitlerinema sp. PCC 7407]